MVEAMDGDTARRVCQLVAGVLCSDGEMNEDERAFLKRVLEGFGMPTDVALMPTYEEDVAGVLRGLPEAHRWRALDLVIKSAVVDGMITPQERGIIDVVAKELDIPHDDLIDRFRRELPPLVEP